MAKQTRREIYITCNGKSADDMLRTLTNHAAQLDAQIKKLIADGKGNTKECKELVSVHKQLSKQLKQNISNTQMIDKVMRNLAGSTTAQLRNALQAVRREISRSSEASGKLPQLRKQMEAIKAQIDKNTGAIHKQGGAWSTAMKNLTAYVGLFGAFNMLKSKLTEILNLNFKLGDQLADIRKVSGWAMDDVNELSKRLAKIDTRNSIQQLNDLAYQGAKLGIGKYGVDGLTRFAEATAQIRMALHEDMGDEAIAQLAKMAEVMGDMNKMGVSQSLLASGSAIFKLSATTTACGSNIMEFSKRLLGLGKTADLTTPQILALGSAADSMALMPEVASTAFNKFITTLQSKYSQVAKAVGMNQDRLKSLLDQHQTMEAIVEVLEHMRDMGDLNALAPIMGDLGSEGARLTNVFASMAANVDMLKEHLATSEDEFQKATAITAEFDIQNETSQALIERANNIWEKSFVNSDNAAGGIKDIAMAWYDMTKAITGSISFMTEAGLLLKGLAYGIQVLIGALPALINGLIYLGAVKLAAWTQWPVLFGMAKASINRVSTSMLNLVGIQTAAQKSAIATASANQALAEEMYAQALSAKNTAVANQALAVTQEEVAAANTALSNANANLIAAQEMLAGSTLELSAATKIDSATLLEESETKILDAAATANLTSSEAFLTENKGMATAMTNAEAAAVAKETAAKESNITATKNMRMVWGAILFVSLVALIDKLYDNFKKLNAEEERNKEVTDKIANGLATANKEYEDACKNLRVLYGELERNWNQMDERKRLIGEINAKYGDYVDNLVTETTKMSELTGSYNDATDALREYYYYKQKEALRADLVTEEQHKGDVSFMKLQNMGGKYQDHISLALARSAIKEYAKSGVSAASITDNLWHDFFGGKAPGNYYMDLSKLPLIGGAFPKNTFRSEEQEAMTYLFDFVKSYVVAMNNEGAIEKNFPGEWTPPKRKIKKSKDNVHNATTPEDDSRANISEFITKIKNLYARQITAATEKMTTDGIEKELQEQALDDIKVKRDAVLAKAQQAIVLGKAGEWDSYKKTIAGDIKEQPDEYGQSQSLSLLESINTADVRKMRADLLKQMPKIKKGQVVGSKSDERDRAYLDKMWLDASKNEGKEASVEQKRMEKRRKELLEHSYTGVVKENSFLGLVSSGYAKVNLDQLERDKGDVFTVLEKARQDLAGLFSTNAEKDRLLKFLFGEDYSQTPDVFASLLKMSEEDAALFYQKLIQYSDEYAAAEKKQYDDAKKITDFLWKRDKRNIDQQDKLRKIQNESKLFGKRTNLLSNLGLANLTADPEIELMKARMQAAEDYYAFVERNTKNKQLIDEAERARQEAELAYANQMATAMKSRLSQMKELVQPIEDFGGTVGQALAEMRYDAESANDAIKSALKSMLEAWGKMALNDVNTQMWKAINDAAAKRGRDNAQPDIDAARANANANVIMPDFTNIGTEQNPVWVRIVDNHYENANGDRVGAPRAWRKRNGYSTEDDRDGFTDYVGQVGGEVAGVVTSGGSLSSMAASGIGAALNAPIGGKGKKDKKEEKQRKKQLREEKKHQKELSKEVKKGTKEREKTTDKGVKNITATTEQGNKEQSKGTEFANQTMLNSTDATLNATLTAKQKNNDEVVKSDAQRTQGEVTFSIAGAMAKCFEFLGPIAGPIAAAVVMSTLMGLLQWALSSAFSGKKKNSSKATNTKVTSGMLTYDSGNVQDLRPFVGNDGSLYWASENNKPHDGVSLLTQPTATTINGQPSLVAENGPELVIGRETTQAMMMNNPQLLKALVNYDRNYSGRSASRRAFDNGNVGETIGNLPSGASATDDLLTASTASNAALLQAVEALLVRLDEPIEARIDMYGRGKLYDSMTKANQFMKNKS